VKREQRLRSSADFSRVRERAPRAWAHPLLVLYAAPNDLPGTRVGITVSGRVGKAVVRNKIRRRIREAVRLLLPRLVPAYDLVFIARPASASADWPQLRQAVEDALARAGVLRCVACTPASCSGAPQE
jgi:ribonuclease P protein component